jgi:hypothetical protein
LKLADLLEPGDQPNQPKKVDMRGLIRKKAFKSLLKALSQVNNPSKDMTPELAGEGGHDEPPTDDKAKSSALL